MRRRDDYCVNERCHGTRRNSNIVHYLRLSTHKLKKSHGFYLLQAFMYLFEAAGSVWMGRWFIRLLRS